MTNMEYLNDIWAIYYHHPYDHNWDISSYKLICTISSINEFVEVFHAFKELFHKGMFFIMREHITPRWEDENNMKGGCFSYKLNKINLEENFFESCARVLGETIGNTNIYSSNVNGISISPKKNTYIVRIWIKDNQYASNRNYKINVPKFSTLMYKNHKEEVDMKST